MTASGWVDGTRVPAAAATGPGEHLFETIGLWRGELPLWDRHLARLHASRSAFGWAGGVPTELRAAAQALLADNGHDVVRVAVARGAAGLRWSLTTRRRDAAAVPLSVGWAARARPPGDAAHKRAPRTWLDAERAAARGAGAHDALVWEGEQVLEATAYNLFVVVDGGLRTPPADGRILAGIARAVLIAGLAAAGTPVAEGEVTRAAVRRGVVFLSNAVYGPRRARLPEGVAGPDDDGWGDRLGTVWARAVGS